MQSNTFNLLSCLLLLYASGQRSACARPVQSTDGTELVVVEEILRCTPDWCRNATDAQDNADNESVLDVVDDLIFLAKKPKQKQQQQQQTQNQHAPQPNPSQSAETYHQIDLLTTDEEDTLAASSADLTSAEHDTAGGAVSGGDGGDSDGDADGVTREIELRTDGTDATAAAAAAPPITPIDMSDFVTLIPAEEVKSIAANYYHNDAEVQHAYAYLSSADFTLLKRRIIEVPETAAFLQYLNNSGLDVLGFLDALTNLTANNAAANATAMRNDGPNAVTRTNEIPNTERNATDVNSTTTTTTTTTITTTIDPMQPTFEPNTTTTTTKEQQQLNGLHGLVDSILDVLPQDRILSTFFDKLENNKRFTKLVDNISSPTFARILSNMERSVPLRNLIFNLHNNGIYVTRIVDSLKSYFFLGGF